MELKLNKIVWTVMILVWDAMGLDIMNAIDVIIL